MAVPWWGTGGAGESFVPHLTATSRARSPIYNQLLDCISCLWLCWQRKSCHFWQHLLAFWAAFIWFAETELGFHFFFHSTGVPFMFANWKRVFCSVGRGCVCPLAHLFLISWLESATHQKEQKNNFFLTRCSVFPTGPKAFAALPSWFPL